MLSIGLALFLTGMALGVTLGDDDVDKINNWDQLAITMTLCGVIMMAIATITFLFDLV